MIEILQNIFLFWLCLFTLACAIYGLIKLSELLGGTGRPFALTVWVICLLAIAHALLT